MFLHPIITGFDVPGGVDSASQGANDVVPVGGRAQSSSQADFLRWGNGLHRIAAWIGLLKEIDCRLTTDCYMAYGLATSQTNIVTEELRAYGCDICCGEPCDPGIDSQFDGTRVEHSSGIYRQPVPKASSSTIAGVSKELRKMAEDYMFHRIYTFVSEINMLTNWRFEIVTGTMVPKEFINAMQMSYRTNRTLDDLALTVDMLHSNLIPRVSYGYDSCGVTYLKYPTFTRCLSNGTTRDGWEQLESSKSEVCNGLSHEFSRFSSAIMDAALKNDAETVKKWCAVYARALEIRLYMFCVRYGIDPRPYICLKDISYANKLFLKRGSGDNDGNPAVTKGSACDSVDQSTRAALSNISRITPTAAIMIGSLLDDDYGRVGLGRLGARWSWEAANMFSQIKDTDTHECVAAFILHEYMFQRTNYQYAKNRIETFRRNGRLINDRRNGTCDEASCCR